MAKNDPWGVTSNDSEISSVSRTDSEEQSICSDEVKTKIEKSFGDNFIDNNIIGRDLTSDEDVNPDISSSNFEPMKDSKEYIDRLESKLKRLQKASLQKALSERKSDEARRFLDARIEGLNHISSASTQYSESIIDQGVDDNPLIRKLCPERQAVNLSELEKLLDADSLQKLVEELNNSDCEKEEDTNEMSQSDNPASSK